MNLGGGFDTERKGAKERKNSSIRASRDACVGRLGEPVLAVEPCGPTPGGTPWGWGGGQREQVSIRYRPGRVQRGGEAS